MMADLCARANRTDSLLLVLTLVALATGSFLCMASSASATAQDFVPLTTFNGVACASPNQCIGVGTAASGVKSGAAAPLNPVSGDLSTGQSFQLNWIEWAPQWSELPVPFGLSGRGGKSQ